ncbi:Xaa-Pro aminopeptidase [Trachipleistophora hominis]|uniref:Xaa-Pro aminopeptidase n=1 Tax=Trachipleistophora hominis TaxID=72359 RepID=L7JUR8_TRAHO|nr:Xaa-Pro aminopeptidase [Trachipleistophora hominis]
MNLLNALLTQLTLNNLDAYILNHTDEHLSEFISDADMRVKRLTGFTGSNGTVVVTKTECALYTDSRYYLQAQKELIEPFKMMKIGVDKSLLEFLKDTIKEGRVGVSLRLISHERYKEMTKEFESTKLVLVPVENELVDIIWKDRPRRSASDIIDLEKYALDEYLTFLKNDKVRKIFDDLFKDNYKYEYDEMIEPDLIPGLTYSNKIGIVQKSLQENEAMILSSLDSIAWLLNLRGRDIANNTVFYAYVYITKDRLVIFTDVKVPRDIELRKYSEFYMFLKRIEENTVYVSDNVNASIADILGEDRMKKNNLVAKLKSVKNRNEIMGFFQAAILDGVALVKLFTWLNKNGDRVTEIGISDRLLEIKSQLVLGRDEDMVNNNKEDNASLATDRIGDTMHTNPLLVDMGSKELTNLVFELFTGKLTEQNKSLLQNMARINKNMFSSSPVKSPKAAKNNASNKNGGWNIAKTGFLFPSFSTIIGYGKHGAIVHHSASDTTVDDKNLILIDCGSQFIFATTDISRTIHLGTPSSEQIHDFTNVLKGQLLSKRLVGPKKNVGGLIQDLPRYYLWPEGKNYEHGTSHGVGTALYVHESPPEIRFGATIEAHQIFTIEPGYYKEDNYGVRIEDAVISLYNDNIFLQNMTFVPLQLNLLDDSLLTDEEVEYLNKYNENVRNILGEYLYDEKEKEWLINNTRFFNRV